MYVLRGGLTLSISENLPSMHVKGLPQGQQLYRRALHINSKQKHRTTVRSEAERFIDHNLPVCHPLTEVMSVQQLQTLPSIYLGRTIGRLSC